MFEQPREKKLKTTVETEQYKPGLILSQAGTLERRRRTSERKVKYGTIPKITLQGGTPQLEKATIN